MSIENSSPLYLKNNRFIEFIKIHRESFGMIFDIIKEEVLFLNPSERQLVPETRAEKLEDITERLLILGIGTYAVSAYYIIRILDTLYCRKGAVSLLRILADCDNKKEAILYLENAKKGVFEEKTSKVESNEQ